ncbi:MULTISPECIES: ABC transporter ATP-binding protein [Rhodomicrobium]|uniref:branched-chain amino acid ABC transporter permease n=1 Tax=Rhodomicrobium TaxID=1068 RepID=UPI000B4A7B5A|nr:MULTISPECIES: ABC transporter ATP-binding protein [Rhodomicrobium]
MTERLTRYGPFLLALIALVAPLLAPNDYVIGVLARICLYALLALGLNIVVGFAGLLDLGFVAFFGIGSYVYAFLASPHFGLHLPFAAVMLVIIFTAAGSGVLIGAPTLRLRGDYLAIVTLGFGEITYICLVNLDRPVNITGGPNGLLSIDPPSFLGFVIDHNIEYYYLFLLTLGLVVLLSRRLRDSRIGWAWRAIREDEIAAEAMGVNTTMAKLQAFAVGASIAGFAGGLLASWQRSVFPDNFLLQESINILAMVILGGLGSVLGAILGAVAIVSLPEIFRDFALYRLLAFGLILILVMILRPQGLLAPRSGARRSAETK